MRREFKITIPVDGPDVPERRKNRDGGKTFKITEWPAERGEAWANRAILAIGNSGAKIDHVKGSGMAGIAILGVRSLLGITEGPALALVNELMECVTIIVPAAPDGRPIVSEDIEEISTRWRLKTEVFATHTGFSWAEIRSMLISAGEKAEAFADTLNTSRRPSHTSSRRKKPRTRN